ncbi:DUF1731 domain-containing protein [Brevibacillus sp. GCM10020057]|uniref:DUF1731 domain-containing protein n=1 Tax=Brevibacillus sp. GCM10020057 TaxID=3317327 RepID=UPI003642B667
MKSWAKRLCWQAAPAPLVWLGTCLVMRADPGLALTGRNCIPAKWLEHGFSFAYTDLEPALRDLLVSAEKA